jgi:anti-sigma factor RsiW
MSNRRCDEWEGAIVDRLVGELPEGEAILLEQHLSECPACTRREEALRTLIEAAGSPGAFSVNPALEEDLLRRLHDGQEESRGRSRSPGPQRFGSAWSRFPRLLLRPIPVYVALILLAAACLSGVWVGRSGEGGRFVGSLPPGSPAVEPVARQDSLVPGHAGPTRRNGGFVATPSDALCLVGVLGSDTL